MEQPKICAKGGISVIYMRRQDSAVIFLKRIDKTTNDKSCFNFKKTIIILSLYVGPLGAREDHFEF